MHSGLSRLGPPVGKRVQKGWLANGDGKILWEEVPIEWPGPGELLIRVRAAGLCGSDLAQVNEYSVAPLGESPILGLEIAGEVVAVGSDIGLFQDGDRVCCCVAGGGFSEFCTCPAILCLPLPNNLSWPEAGALPLAIMTGKALMQISSDAHNQMLHCCSRCRLDRTLRSWTVESGNGDHDTRCFRRGWTHLDSTCKGLQSCRSRHLLKQRKSSGMQRYRSGLSSLSEHG